MPENHTNRQTTESVGTVVSGLGLSYAITSIFSALLVVLKESSETIHHLLTVVTGHHWITHGVLDLALFLGLGYLLCRANGITRVTVNMLILSMVGATVISGLIIVGYFI